MHDSLVLFTRISLRDVDNYTEHYKKLFYYLNNFIETSDLVKVVEKLLEWEQINLKLKKKEHDNKALSRTR